jgi:hypothetical protein
MKRGCATTGSSTAPTTICTTSTTTLNGLEESAQWEVYDAGSIAADPLALLTYDRYAAKLWPAGLLRLRKHHVVLARWYWLNTEGEAKGLWLLAAPSAEHYFRLHRELETRRHTGAAVVWQIVRGAPHADGERVPRDLKAGDELLLPQDIRAKLEMDVIRFFDADVTALYSAMGVPHRRGVLLHGPPGNGKTSMIRYIGAARPLIPAMILRPPAGFDTDDLEMVLNRWRRQAPAILVIEDLNWLLEAVNVSTFLNMLDGIETNATGGLLLIATTNHPDKLDSAINNRPGRFDVVIEVPCPNRELRREFFRRKLPAMDDALLEQVATATQDVSFSHLQEIIRLSGLLAIYAGRTDRNEQDLLGAVATVRGTQDQAARGFAPKPEVPFGLASWHSRAETNR